MVETLEKKDIKLYYSTKQQSGSLYLGGARTVVEFSDNYLHNLLQKTTDEEQVTGIQKFKCVYVYNDHATVYLKNPAAFVVSDTTSPNDFIELGWGTSQIGSGLSGSTDNSIEQQIVNQSTPPNDVMFYGGNTRSKGAILNNDIPYQKGKALWIKYTSLFNAQDFPYDTWKLRIVSDNLITDVLERDTSHLPPQVLINVIGNCSSDADFTQLAEKMLPSNPHMYITTGNNNTESNPSFFFSVMGAANISKSLLAFGPFDVVNDTVKNAYVNEMSKYPFVTNPQRTYFSKNYGNVHVLVMNTSGNIPYLNPSPQYDFVLNDLQAANTNPTIEWIFVVTNRPVFGPLVTNNTRLYYNDIAKTYHQMFVDNGVLVVFQGQINHYVRSSVLKFNPATPLTPQALAYDGPNNYTILGQKNFKEGLIYMTVGWSGNIHDFITAIAPGEQNVEFYNTGDFGYVRIIVENRLDVPKVIFRAYFTTRNVQFFLDQFTVTRTS